MPNSIQLSGVGATNAQTIAVQESGYAGRFGENDTCSGIATIAAGSMNGPTASYTVTGVAAGSCNVTFSDTFGQRQAVSVTVTTSGFNVQ